MGIEDFLVDSNEHAERVLLISPDSEQSSKMQSVLNSKYVCSHADNLVAANALSNDDLFDVIIIDLPDLKIDPIGVLELVIADRSLRRAPIIIAHEQAANISPSSLDDLPVPVEFVVRPVEVTSLLVKVAHQLRMRKVRAGENRFLSKLASQNVALRDLTTRFRRELQEAQSIQNAILPTALPSAPGISFAATYVPLEAVGGDLYDIWKISDSTYGMFIGDVTGHGLPAAFIGAMTKMALSFGEKTSPEITLNQVNAALAPLMPEGRFVTAALAFYNTDTAELLVARAGHPSPILYRASSGSTELLAAKGLPLGVLPESRYQVLKTTLGVGDKLLFITDGISETSNLSGQMLGDEGLAKEFQRLCPDHSISDCLTELLAFQETYSEGRLVKDDITIIGLERCE